MGWTGGAEGGANPRVYGSKRQHSKIANEKRRVVGRDEKTEPCINVPMASNPLARHPETGDVGLANLLPQLALASQQPRVSRGRRAG